MDSAGAKLSPTGAKLTPTGGFAGVRGMAAGSPAFGCYLLAVALLPLRWLSPLSSVQEHGIWTDALLAVAAVLWLVEKVRGHELTRAGRRWHGPLAVYLLLASVSTALAVPGRGGSWKAMLLMVELALLAVITADFAAAPAKRRVIARVIVASSIVTVVLGAIGFILFSAGVGSGLVGGYGDLTPSRWYARVQAGFESPPLLASFCIFASGIIASKDARLSPRTCLAAQISLGLLCAVTFSRGLIGFLFALILRRSAAMRGSLRTLVSIGAAIASLGILAPLTVGRLQFNPAEPATFSYAAPGPENPRLDAFTTSLAAVQHHPLLGIGPGGLPGTHLGAPIRAHLTPLNVAATIGLPALCALFAMLWLLWRSRRRPTDVALWSALAGIGLDGLVGDIDHYRHVWILLGLLG